MKNTEMLHTKICSKCGAEKQIGDFNRCGAGRRRPNCNECSSKVHAIRTKKLREQRLAQIEKSSDEESRKRCIRCGFIKTIGHFHLRSSTGTKRRGVCAECIIKQRKLRLEKKSTSTEEPKTPQPRCYKIDTKVLDEIKTMNLDAMRDKRKASSWPDDPIEQAKLLYWRAWNRIVPNP